MAAVFRVSVRELVALCFPPVDITPGGDREAMLAGGRAHRARQERQEGQTERPISHVFSLDGELIELFGRMDAFCDGDCPLIEEMKLSDWQGEGLMPEHRAQAVCYGAMVAAQEGRESVRLCISYLSKEGDVLRSFTETLTAEEMLTPVLAWLRVCLRIALREQAHREKRDASIRALAFPFPSYRTGQRELAVQVYTAIGRKRRLFASLPTGVGKSAAVLYPALKALGEGKTERILYLTARNTARQSPLQALEKMKQQGLCARVGVLTAKEKLCRHLTRCHPDDCPRAKGHYPRQESAVDELLQGNDIWTDERILEAAARHTCCPFELALRLTELSDVTLMDMNYVFDPFAQVKRLMERRRRCTMLVDEAHHAVDRVRESLSGELDSGAFASFRAAFGKERGRKHPYYLALSGLVKALRGLEGEGERRLADAPEDVCRWVRKVEEEAGNVLAAPGGANLADIFAALRLCLPFLYALERLGEDYAVLQSAHGKERTLCLYCLLPAKDIAAATKGVRGAVFFSATLSPLPAMKELLGGQEEDACFSLPSPFPPENLAVVRRRISTKYEDRRESAGLVAQSIATAVCSRPGKYIAYFPSYAYLDMVRGQLDESFLPPLFVQTKDMGEEERDRFFDLFSRDGAPRLGLCVLGGLFSEGVDLPGECLVGVIVVGVGLPTPSVKMRAIQDCYAAHFGDGFGYACRIPAMQKVSQAGGRVVRSETDKGLLVLIDSRYYETTYTALLPAHWRLTNEDVAGAARELWK